MTLGNIKDQICGILERDRSVFKQGTLDLLHAHLDMARKAVEREHDFAFQNAVGYLSVDPTAGASLDDALNRADDSAMSIKSVQMFYYRTAADDLAPIRHYTKNRMAKMAIDELDKYRVTRDEAYLPDLPVTLDSLYSMEVYLHGKQIYIEPQQDVATTIDFDCQVWMTDYVGQNDAYTDWMLEHGHDYLMWAAVCSLNFKTKTFSVSRDGGIAAPEKQRELSRQALIAWDDYYASTSSPTLNK